MAWNRIKLVKIDFDNRVSGFNLQKNVQNWVSPGMMNWVVEKPTLPFYARPAIRNVSACRSKPYYFSFS